MPITDSAKKALRQSKRKHAANLIRKDAAKDAIKKFKRLLAAKQMDEARKLLPTIYQALDKAAKTNVMHRNKAARLKSRIAAKVK